MQLKSKTGRKIRKDSFEANHNMEAIFEHLKYLYIDCQLSTNQIPEKMLQDYNIFISSSKCYELIEKMGILRKKSEAISLATSTLDYSISLLSEEMAGIIEGMLIGDATINVNNKTKVGRLSISGSHQEFIQYCNRLLTPYQPSSPRYDRGDGKKGGTGTWSTTTKFHPDFYKMYKKWYIPQKDVPKNLNFTSMFMLLWYLGDGSLSSRALENSIALYFSTNSFSRKALVENIIPSFEKLGFFVSRITKDNRLFIKTESIGDLLKYMGGKSPVECYSYKFDIDEWRFLKTMKQASVELDIDYQRLASWVKTGIVNHSRSPGGKKVLFTEQEFNELKRRLDCGELSRVKGRKSLRQKSTIVKKPILRNPNEGEDEYINRVVKFYISQGFPYKDYSESKKQKKWTRLRASQYIYPDSDVLKWRKHGLPLADSFHPHIYELNRKNKISPYSLFNNEKMLKECLLRHKAKDGTMTAPKLLSAVCSDARSPRLNNFSPSLARDIYNYYCKDGYRVIDPCAGFSGRLLGASVSKRKISYCGIDPSIRTYSGLVKTVEFLKTVNPCFECHINNGCAEVELEKYRDNYFDFCFTSPPYFNIEEYDLEKTQSYLKFNTYEKWKDGFLRKIILEVFRVLKAGGICAINIGKFNTHDIAEDIISLSLDAGFHLIEKKAISFPVYGFVNSKSRERLEQMPILMK